MHTIITKKYESIFSFDFIITLVEQKTVAIIIHDNIDLNRIWNWREAIYDVKTNINKAIRYDSPLSKVINVFLLNKKSKIPTKKRPNKKNSDGNRFNIFPLTAKGDNRAIKGIDRGKIILFFKLRNIDSNSAIHVGTEDRL